MFLRTSKIAGWRSILKALRLTQVEMILAVALNVCVGLLAGVAHRPWLLIVIIFLQATVYLCGPIASVWNLWAVGVPAPAYRRRFDERRQRAQRRRWAWVPSPRPAAAGAVLAALCGSELHDLLTIFLSTTGSGGIDHVVNETGRSSTAANPDAAVDVVSYP